jgi:hypothetical protein
MLDNEIRKTNQEKKSFVALTWACSKEPGK